jgi:hypothetical protein
MTLALLLKVAEARSLTAKRKPPNTSLELTMGAGGSAQDVWVAEC